MRHLVGPWDPLRFYRERAGDSRVTAAGTQKGNGARSGRKVKSVGRFLKRT